MNQAGFDLVLQGECRQFSQPLTRRVIDGEGARCGGSSGIQTQQDGFKPQGLGDAIFLPDVPASASEWL